MLRAYCYASGLIAFGRKLPDGALPIARGPAKALREFIEVKARHGYQTRRVKGRLQKVPGTECLLVPGVPEAANEFAKLDSLRAWKGWIAGHARDGVTVAT